jgi:hypothetical protein
MPAHSMSSELFDVKGSDSKEKIQQHFQTKFKDVNIKSEVIGESDKDKFISASFSPAQTLNISPSDKFEHIEASESGDIKNSEILLGDPKSGRVFHLNSELKVFKLDVLPIWQSKAKLKTLREIISDLSETKVVKKSSKKKEARK